MAPDTKAWAHLGALGTMGAYFPLSAPRARVCVDYTETASPCVPRVPLREFAPVWLRGGNRPNPYLPLPKKEAVTRIDGLIDAASDNLSEGEARISRLFWQIESHCLTRQLTRAANSGGARP